MNNILVATDLSPKAQLATDVGISLAKQFNSDIHLLHVFHTPVDWTKLPKEHEGRFKEVKAKLAVAKGILAQAVSNAKAKGVEATSFVSYDHENMNVVQHIQSHKHDMVVIGAHSKLTIADVLLGSVAISIIEDSPVPILMVDEADKFTAVGSLLVAVDTEMNAVDFVKKISTLFPDSQVKINVFSVQTNTYSPSKKMIDGLNQFIRKQTGPNVTYEVVKAASVEEGIIEKANGNNGDLLVIGSNRFNRVADYLRTHVFPSISARVAVPVLILK